VLLSNDIKQRLFNAGSESVGSTPDSLADMMKRDVARIGELVKDTGIREQ
jgi:tripartite-type tricarboxylate transporter receptor subunit TctC